jgi:hypothetical protein
MEKPLYLLFLGVAAEIAEPRRKENVESFMERSTNIPES